MVGVVFHCPGGFRELLEAYRSHLHLSLYLLVPVVMSYGQKPWGELFLPGTGGCLKTREAFYESGFFEMLQAKTREVCEPILYTNSLKTCLVGLFSNLHSYSYYVLLRSNFNSRGVNTREVF